MSGPKKSINTLHISQDQRTKLIRNGYTTVADIHAISASELSKDLGLSLEEAMFIIQASKPPTRSQIVPPENNWPLESQRTHITIGGSQTAAALLRVPASATALSLGARAIDNLLGGGALKGCVTEICGVPGSGRTAAVLSAFASATRAGYESLVIGE
ncbi:DNA repair helicase RHP51 [Ceratobasidium sp. AG-Ba]|nr:DNA repair helicase RHP51 [Ceratobasidium sp. AG-Ba]